MAGWSVAGGGGSFMAGGRWGGNLMAGGRWGGRRLVDD